MKRFFLCCFCCDLVFSLLRSTLAGNVIVNLLLQITVDIELGAENDKRNNKQNGRNAKAKNANHFLCGFIDNACGNLLIVAHNSKAAKKEDCLNGVCHFLQKSLH